MTLSFAQLWVKDIVCPSHEFANLGTMSGMQWTMQWTARVEYKLGGSRRMSSGLLQESGNSMCLPRYLMIECITTCPPSSTTPSASGSSATGITRWYLVGSSNMMVDPLQRVIPRQGFLAPFLDFPKHIHPVSGRRRGLVLTWKSTPHRLQRHMGLGGRAVVGARPEDSMTNRPCVNRTWDAHMWAAGRSALHVASCVADWNPKTST